MKKAFQIGGLYKTNKKAFIDSTLNANKHLDWVKRLYQPNTPTIILPGENQSSTHFMESGDGLVYPTIVNQNGKLNYLGDNARRYADSTRTGIQFQNDEQATWFGNNYKKGTNVLKKFQGGSQYQGPRKYLPSLGIYTDQIQPDLWKDMSPNLNTQQQSGTYLPNLGMNTNQIQPQLYQDMKTTDRENQQVLKNMPTYAPQNPTVPLKNKVNPINFGQLDPLLLPTATAMFSILGKRREQQRQDAWAQQNMANGDFNGTYSRAANDYGSEYQGGGEVEEEEDDFDFMFNEDIQPTPEPEPSQVDQLVGPVDEDVDDSQSEENQLALQLAMEDSAERTRMALRGSSPSGREGEDDGSYSAEGYSTQAVSGQAVGAKEQEVMSYLQTKHGLPKHAAAAITSNMKAESGLNPTAVGDNGSSYGVFQWRDPQPNRGRKTAMLTWMKENGRNPNDIFAQIDYGMYEGIQRGDVQRTVNAPDASSAAFAWAKHFERPARVEQKRMTHANTLMKYEQGGEYDLDQEKINELIKKGYKFDIL